jgi:hypothetical protein
MRRDRVRRHARLRLMKRDLDSHTSSRSLTHPAGNLNNKPAARNDHTAQPETEPALNRFALKPLALGEAARYLGHWKRQHCGVDRIEARGWYPSHLPNRPPSDRLGCAVYSQVDNGFSATVRVLGCSAVRTCTIRPYVSSKILSAFSCSPSALRFMARLLAAMRVLGWSVAVQQASEA